jgi:hypothetical protein
MFEIPTVSLRTTRFEFFNVEPVDISRNRWALKG